MRSGLAAWAIGLVLACAAAPAHADEPHLVTLAAGGGGRIIVDPGDTPPSVRPRVVLRRLDPPAAEGEKPLTFTRRVRRVYDNWRANVGRMPAGRYEVRLRLRGKPDRLLSTEFRIEPPVLDDPGVLPVRPGGRLHLYGKFFGRTGFRVHLGSRRMRLVGRRSLSSTTIRIPKRMPPGDYPLTLSTASGSATAATLLRVGGALFEAIEDEIDTEVQGLVRYVDMGFDAADRPRHHEISARRRDPDLVQITLGSTHSRRDFNELTFAIPDVFHANIDEPVVVRSTWAVLQMRPQDAERSSPPLWWSRDGGLVVTIEAYDHRSGYFVLRFTGGLHPTDRFGEPRDGPTVQFRGGVVATELSETGRPPVDSTLMLDLRDPATVDADLTTARVDYRYIVAAEGWPPESVLVTTFHDLGSFDAELGRPGDSHLRTYVPVGTAILIEAQAAPALHPDRPILDPEPDLGNLSEWAPVRLWDDTGRLEGAFADRGYARQEFGTLRTFDLAPLNGRGYRLLRFRVTIRIDVPPVVVETTTGPQPSVGELSAPVRVFPDLR